MNTRLDRRSFLCGGLAATTAFWTGCCSKGLGATHVKNACLNGNHLQLTWPTLAEDLHIWVVGDTHLALHDARDAAYAGNYARMAQWPGNKEAFEKMLAQAKKANLDLLILVGDIISFPTYANVDYLKNALAKSGVPWIYVAGNHDWHFEGVPGSDLAQRASWIKERLLPLYQGANPLRTSRLVKGVRFIMIDNSCYHVLPEQLDFYNAEVAKGDPVCVCMHIPLWMPNCGGVTTCACPTWGAATDPYWQIERRERWAERLLPSTYAFREAVLATENLVALFAGHIHKMQMIRYANQNLITVPGNAKGNYLDVQFKV